MLEDDKDMQDKINDVVVNKMVSDIEKEVIRFKRNGYSQKKVTGLINKCYIEVLLKGKEDDNFCFVGNEKLTVKAILTRVRQVIKKQFYSKYDSTNYYAPTIEKINVDTNYEVRRVGNVSEITFDDPTKVVGQDVRVEYSTEGKPCNYEREFTDDGKLIATCNFDSNDEEGKNNE